MRQIFIWVTNSFLVETLNLSGFMSHVTKQENSKLWCYSVTVLMMIFAVNLLCFAPEEPIYFFVRCFQLQPQFMYTCSLSFFWHINCIFPVHMIVTDAAISLTKNDLDHDLDLDIALQHLDSREQMN